jgi:O-acetyl-ADP-ribose deacetylase (regulator of RNase III)
LIHKTISSAQNHGDSIAFPTVGSGGMKYPEREVAHIFKEAAEKFSQMKVGIKLLLYYS